ncbi:MAG: 30S ribosome-binding factor RbfA [Candidatus Margulisiibacteriota bacterium]
MTRQERSEELIRAEVSRIIREDVNDPRIGFISITRVKLSPDLTSAAIYVSIMGDEEQKQAGMAGLFSASRFIRGELGESLEFRSVPQIRFVRDDSLERGSRVLAAMRKLGTDETRTRTNKKPPKRR